ncbi:tRNA adenosine(34) deaminase TadA [Lactobacillus xylocopicola]|uniref:tRNA-specific adenosine deaminase n=1 Tax=Lactobacillus xylocopicola TaxID=2976676 RepID=A0ABN6SNQ7_9LACO|nr:tRNA adenosine(34) deaminase TadA [Lactobacillus xylocopicola]BDR60822.1 tRNA-specific adenosine deaminase [Lactobacillus xylocopicola]
MDLSSAAKKKYMELAFAEAKKAQDLHEVPIGAIVVNANGEVVGAGFNHRELDQDATQHAELIAIRQACATLGTWRLLDCSLFVTLEPCPMCAGAIINARLKQVVYGAADPKAGAAGSVVNLFDVAKFNHHPQIIRGMYRDEASQMLKKFFQEIRRQQKQQKLISDSGENNKNTTN